MKPINHISYPAIKTATRNVAAFAILTLTFVTALGGQPGTGGGTIFYIHTCCRTMWTMNSDGTGQTQPGGLGDFGSVSTQKYNGHYWFIDVRTLSPSEYYPNGDLRAEVFAYRDDYDQNTNSNPATHVELTNDITLQASSGSGDPARTLQWVPGGQMISIKARRWSGSNIVEGGIYTAYLQFGPDGNITGLAAQPGAVAIPFALDANLWPNFRSYCWNPTATKVAYEDTMALRIADLLGSPPQTIYNAPARLPQWSPDGTSIAFTDSNAGISTVRPDGTHLTAIIRRTPSWIYDRPFWSPTGSHVVCYGSSTSGDSDIFRAGSNGNFLTNLTNTPSTPEMSMGWR